MADPILVTGSHRSGSTWVGRMLAASPRVGYISEPFSPNHRPGICAAEFEQWFTYVTEANEDGYREHVERMLAFRYRVTRELRSLPATWRGARLRRELGAEGTAGTAVAVGAPPRIAKALPMPRPARHLVKDGAAFAQHRIRRARPLVKDPMALFSAEWLADRFGAQPVLLVRHPGAFAQSLRRVGWRFPFADLLEQPLLMRDHLAPWRADIEAFAEHEHDLIDQAGLLWTLIHQQIKGYRERHPDWIVLRHEDLSRDPLHAFGELYDRLGLPYGEREQSAVHEHTQAGNPAAVAGDRVEVLRRDSRANVDAWRTKLDDDELSRVRNRVRGVAPAFYPEEDW